MQRREGNGRMGWWSEAGLPRLFLGGAERTSQSLVRGARQYNYGTAVLRKVTSVTEKHMPWYLAVRPVGSGC